VTDSDSTVLRVRHGRTALNAAGLLRGRLDSPLDVVGELEAQALGKTFRSCRISTVVTSPLLRAHQTASAIAEAAHSPLEVDADLADRDYGRWSGRSLAEINRQFGSVDLAPGVEPMSSFAGRVVTAVVDAANRSALSSVVIVAHDAVNRVVLSHLVPALAQRVHFPQATGCWNRLERRGKSCSAPIVGSKPQVVGHHLG
jgi:broad specificity phosphatase PhoE